MWARVALVLSVWVVPAFAASIFSGHGTLKSNEPTPVIREITANVELGVLEDLRSGATTNATLNLFPDLAFDLTVVNVTSRNMGSYEISAVLQGISDTAVFLSIREGYIAGFIDAASGSIHKVEFDTNFGSGYKITEQSILGENTPFCNQELAGPSSDCTSKYPQRCFECIGSPATAIQNIDVLVGYSQQFKSRFLGIRPLVELYFDASFAWANLTHERSGSFARLRCIAVEETNYDEGGPLLRDGTLETQLCALALGDDTLGELHAARDRVQADFVLLYLAGNPLTVTAGLAKEIGVRDNEAFAVITPFSLGGLLTGHILLAHETGHMFGLSHHGSPTSLGSYAQGFIFGPLQIIPGEFGFFSTVMVGSTDIAIPRAVFSNPSRNWGIWQLGDPEYGDETRMLNQTSPFMSQFRKGTLGKFEVLGQTGSVLAQFLDTGNVFIQGGLIENSTESMLNQSGSVGDLIVKSGGNTIVARLRATDGALLLAGALREKWGEISGSSRCFSLRDDSGSIVASIDAVGNLTIRGILGEHYSGQWF